MLGTWLKAFTVSYHSALYLDTLEKIRRFRFISVYIDDVNAGVIYGANGLVATNLSGVYTGGVSYRLAIAFGISASVTYEGHFGLAFVDSNNDMLSMLDFEATDLNTNRLRQLQLDHTVGFGQVEAGQTIRIAIKVYGQGPSPIFTRIR
jgi:hypothetical protein